MKKQTFRFLKKYPVFLKIIFILSVLKVSGNDTLKAQNELNVLRKANNWENNWYQFTDAKNSLYHHLSTQACNLLDKRSHEIAELNTISDWQKRQEAIRETLMDIVGPFPEKTALNAKVLRIVKKAGYRVEHIVYESQPGFYVTSSLFIPDGLRKGNRAPAVLYCSGHTNIAYRRRTGTYQHLILNLVKKGFIVFAFDPAGQGERIQYYDTETEKSVIGGPTSEHSYSGVQAFISGSSQARHMIFDGIRAVDYLLTRKEIDPERIGITGCSGGGTQTAYIAAFDERLKAAVPQCYITNFTRLLQSIGPQDAEQNLYHGILRGIDQSDFLLVRAPKPVLILSTTEDFFSIQGARETAREVSQIYRAYGALDNFGMVEDVGPHGTTPKNREAMYAFFQKHLNQPGTSDEEEVELLTDEEMQVTSTGQVSTSFGGEIVFSLNSKYSEKLIARLDSSRQNLTSHIPRILNSARELSGYMEPVEIDEQVFNGQIMRDDYVIEKYFVKGEGNYVIPYLLMKPDKPNNKALIYLHPLGKSAEASPGGEIEWFVKNGFTVLAPDMIGIGEIGGDNTRSKKEWYASILIGRSIVGIQAGDVTRLIRLLEKNNGISEIYGMARKEMSPVLLYTAAFNPSITRIALIEPYSSYRSIVMNRFYDPVFVNSTVAGSLQAYDLPDLAASLAPRNLMLVGVTNGEGNFENRENIMEDMSVIKAAYDYNNASGNMNIIYGKLSGMLNDLFLVWIR